MGANAPVVTGPTKQTGSDALFCTWTLDASHIKEYQYKWYYKVDGTWFIGNEGTTEYRNSLYTPPSNAKSVLFRVKGISTTYRSNDKDINYWTGDWSADAVYNISDLPPIDVPGSLNVEIDGYQLKGSITNIPPFAESRANNVHFQIYKDNVNYKMVSTSIKNGEASLDTTVEAGSRYKVRARLYRISGTVTIYGNWSDFTTDDLRTPPNPPSKIQELYQLDKNHVVINWAKSPTETKATIEYTDKRRWWDSNPEAVRTKTIESDVISHAEIEFGDEDLGKRWFFRVRSENDSGVSPWCPANSNETPYVDIGSKPEEPTTWSTVSTAVVGENITLNWIHNSADGSPLHETTISLKYNGVPQPDIIKKKTQIEGQENNSDSYILSTKSFQAGTKIEWSVKTKGYMPDYSPSSITRSISVYVKPSVNVLLYDKDWNPITEVTTFPFRIRCEAHPSDQTPLSFGVSVLSFNTYVTVDEYGYRKVINSGDALYSEVLQTDHSNPRILNILFNPDKIDLRNNVKYRVKVLITTDAGLSASGYVDFTVKWTDEKTPPNASINIDRENYTCSIIPSLTDKTGKLISGATLAVYRREYDGSFVEIEKGIANTGHTAVLDPHPTLDYVRYRIIATYKDTGAITYYDAMEYFGEKSIIIQWDEKYSDYVLSEETPDSFEDQPYSGTTLRLPYNIDLSDDIQNESTMITYAGRKRPVSYYGIHIDEKAQWSSEIPSDDEETLHKLNRLSLYAGDVYVRGPQGYGYWANVKVSYSKQHLAVTIPVNLSIVRVEGGK